MIRRAIGLLVLAALGCSVGKRPAAERSDVVAEVTRLAPDLVVASRRVELTRSEGSYRVVGARLDASIPGDATAPLRLSAGGDAWLQIRCDGCAPVAARAEMGVVVHEGAAPGRGDVLFVADGDSVEEIRVVRDSGPAEARWVFSVGPGIAAVRAREARIEALDARGVVVLSTAPAVAIDAHGTRRVMDVEVTKDGPLYRARARVAREDLVAPILLDPKWSAAATMSTARVAHTAVRLASGEVLAVGGSNAFGTTALATAERYNPSANTWTAVGSLATARRNHVAVVLPSGKVLVAGGQNGGIALASVELYDPATRTFSAGAAMSVPRVGPDALLLPTGKVLVAGGYGVTSSPRSAEIYDPVTNSWSSGGALVADHTVHRLAPLPGGGVLLVDYSGERWNPSTNTWSTVGTFNRTEAAVAALPSGKVLVAGGYTSTTLDPDGPPLSSAVLFDPATNTFSPTGSMSAARATAGFAVLPSGRVAIVGGNSSVEELASADIYDPATNAFRPAGSMTTRRTQPAAVALGGEAVLVTGGRNSTAVHATTERLVDFLNGAACTSADECASGFCVDGVCCNSACTSACSACDVTTSLGTCSPVASGPPRGARTCGAYLCSGGACATTCSGPGTCATGHICSGSTCVPPKPLGSTCTAAADCGSGNCVDGYCCNSACTGQCAACDLPGLVGLCSPVSGPPRGGRAACSSAGECGGVCNGSDTTKCAPAGPTTPCGTGGCTAGIERRQGFCDGAGTCSATSRSCGAYACGIGVCRTACTTSAECAAGHFCSSSGVCLPLEGLGKECTSSARCASGFCTDGVCCGVAACASGSSCSTAAAKGICARLDGVSCSADAECGSGHCADGVCCNAACGGQCQACNLPFAPGKCTPVVGAAPSGRAPCAADSSDLCSQRLCDGVEGASCAGYVGASVACRAKSCGEGLATVPATCNGTGTCPALVTKSCEGHRCESPTGECLTSCLNDGDCLRGFECTSGRCVARADECSEDGLSVLRADGTVLACAAYVCKGGRCPEVCGASPDCLAGYLCDVASSTCVQPVDSAPEQGGGCAVGRGSRSRSVAVTVLFVLLATAVLRRRRVS